MKDWIFSDTYKLASSESSLTEKKNRYFLSPYDVPKAFRIFRDGSLNLAIEFLYINIDEKHVPYEGSDDGISLEIGEKTQRIYRVILDHAFFDGNEAEILSHDGVVESAIDEFINYQTKVDKSTSKYLVTKNILKKIKQKLPIQKQK